MASFDVIVLGLGAMGSATAYQLARRGKRVLGLEQYALGHDQGSSHGHTRVIRQAYYEHPDYVPLLRRAYDLWYDLEQHTGHHLLTECGCLNIGVPNGELIAGVRASVRAHNLPAELLLASEIRRRFPPFRVDDDMVGIIENRAGFLYVEECVRTFCEAAAALGAELHPEEGVTHWEPEGHGVRVTTTRGTYHADRLVITAGPWATRWLNEMGVPLTVMRQTLQWFRPQEATPFRRDQFPVYLAEVPGGPVYGIPMIDPRGHKAARHYGAPELTDPDQVDRNPHEDDVEPIRAFFRRHLPGANGECTAQQVCLYTMTPDRHFVLDRHPHHPQVAVAAGFSGHGFKFAPVVGEILADLAEFGETTQPIAMFRANRFHAEGFTPKTWLPG
ncbi:MAG: N-methyl-L-tryptophan oxidase [Bacteroidales bacterium]|nr:N-methyl-L-tryptophan oxidase [Bacteroidales bacterium]